MINKYTKEDAKQFSEGNEILEEVLLQCWEKGIQTIGCCAGHYFKDIDALKQNLEPALKAKGFTLCEEYLELKNSTPYIAFANSEEVDNFISHLMNQKFDDEYDFEIVKNNDIYKWGFGIELEVAKERDEEKFVLRTNKFFNWVLNALKLYQNDKKYNCNYDANSLMQKLLEQNTDLKILIEQDNQGVYSLRTDKNVDIKAFKCVEKKFCGFKYLYYNEKEFYYNEELEEVKRKIESIKQEKESNEK